MKESCKPRLEQTRRIVRHLGNDLGLYGTPWLVADSERLCHAVEVSAHDALDEVARCTYQRFILEARPCGCVPSIGPGR